MKNKIKMLLAYLILISFILLTACSSAGSETSIINNLPLTIETETIGNGSIELNPARENNSYERGEKIEIRAKAKDSDSEFVEWRGSIAGEKNPQTITVEEDMKIIARFSGHLAGEGTEDEPYQIANFNDLEMLAKGELPLYKGIYYKLESDIDASPTKDDDYHQGWNPIGDEDNPFQASLDGKGYRIKNLTIDRFDESKIGLFAKIGEKGSVKNLGITEADIHGGRMTGGLAGVNKGLVKRSYVKADIKATANNVGGLIGQNDAGRVEESFTSGSVSGDGFVGGLVGLNDYQTEISNSYSLSEVEALEDGPLGGLIGINRAKVKKSYAAGKIDDTATDKVGGLVWSNSTDGNISSSYFDRELAEQELLIGNDEDSQKGQTTKEMKEEDTFTGWDFTENGIWSIDLEVNEGYPYLEYQIK